MEPKNHPSRKEGDLSKPPLLRSMLIFQGCRDNDPRQSLFSVLLASQERTEKLLEKIQTGEGIGACTFQSAPYWYINLYHLHNMMDVYVHYILYTTYFRIHRYNIYIYIDQIHYSIDLKEPFD